MNLIEIADMIGILTEDIGHTKIPLRLKMFQVNAVQSNIASAIMDQEEDLFIASASHTPTTDGVVLPADFMRVRDVSASGYPIEIVLPAQRHFYGATVRNWLGNNAGIFYAYLCGKTIYYATGINETVTFTYNRRLPKLHRGTAQAGSTSTITLAAEALIGTVEESDDYYNNATIIITSGTGSGQERVVTDYVGSTKVATSAAWTVTPDETSVYEIKCELPEDPDFQIILCEMVADKLGRKNKNAKNDYTDYQTKLGQLSSRNAQNPMIIV